MQPRLKTSRQWTPLPAELIQQMKSVFRQNFQEHIADGEVEVAGKIFPGEILVSMGVRYPKALKQSNWEVSIEYRKEKDNALKMLHLAMDALGALFEQVFTAENDHDFPRVWESVQFEGREIFVQYTTTNSQLEAEADRLLGLDSEEGLAQGDWAEAVTADQIKAQLGLDPEEQSEEDELPPAQKGKKPPH